MELEPPPSEITTFVEQYSDAAMITLRPDGTSHMARVELGVVDGRIQTAGSPQLVRTGNLRRDDRCSLFVFGPHPWWLGLETKTTILEGPDVGHDLVRLMQARHGEVTPLGMVMAHDEDTVCDRLFTEAEYIERAQHEGLIVFDFSVLRAYGNYR